MENKVNRKEKLINSKLKTEKEILNEYFEISQDTLKLHELLKKYKDKEKAIEEYQKLKKRE